MARPLRVEFPRAFYHIINRGNAGEGLFKSVGAREKFLEYLEAASSAGIFGRLGRTARPLSKTSIHGRWKILANRQWISRSKHEENNPSFGQAPMEKP